MPHANALEEGYAKEASTGEFAERHDNLGLADIIGIVAIIVSRQHGLVLTMTRASDLIEADAQSGNSFRSSHHVFSAMLRKSIKLLRAQKMAIPFAAPTMPVGLESADSVEKLGS